MGPVKIGIQLSLLGSGGMTHTAALGY